MKWLQENPFLAGITAFTIVGAGAFAFLLSQALTRSQEASDAYNQAIAKLHGLQERVPFPSVENLEKSKAQTDQYREQVLALRKKLAAMEALLDMSVNPQRFQDDLRASVNEVADKAKEAGVGLPTDFYLGFAQYANSLPSEQAAPFLARQLTVIKQLVLRLIDFRVQSIDGLVRAPLLQEGNTPASPQPAAANQKKGGNSNSATPAKVLERSPFDISFTAEQSKFRVAFNSLLNDNQFLIIRSVSVENTNQAGPPVAQADATPNTAYTATATETAKKDLNVVLGREFVRVALHLEMIDFADPTPEKASK
ncbi:hypothetical protein DB345_11055 [Spartobacteria bacterium LR76]|nr:hypothetical protein DB345_11055 [Spartobacteria bacterium LR76]